MTPGIAAMFGSVPGPMGSVVAEPMVNENLGTFKNISIPVSYMPGPPQNYSIAASDVEYLFPQDDNEHKKLLNTFYSQRSTNPLWKEMGREEEKKAAHYSDKDDKLRKDVKARSTFVRDIVYDPETQKLMVKLGDKYYTYSATPNQLRAFMSAGSLGKEINRIKNGHGSSLHKTTARQQPKVNINSLFGV